MANAQWTELQFTQKCEEQRRSDLKIASTSGRLNFLDSNLDFYDFCRFSSRLFCTNFQSDYRFFDQISQGFTKKFLHMHCQKKNYKNKVWIFAPKLTKFALLFRRAPPRFLMICTLRSLKNCKRMEGSSSLKNATLWRFNSPPPLKVSWKSLANGSVCSIRNELSIANFIFFFGA